MKIEDDLNKTKVKWKTNQSTKINLFGCDTIVNSPSNNISDLSTCPMVTGLILLKDDLILLTRDMPRLYLCSSLSAWLSVLSSDTKTLPGICPNSLSPKLSSSVSISFCVFLHPVLWPLSIVSWDMQWLQPLYSEQQLLELSDLKHNPFYLVIGMDRGDSHLIRDTRGRGSGCGTAAMTMRGAVTNLATPIGGLEVMSWLLHITRRLMNTLNLVATAQ